MGEAHEPQPSVAQPSRALARLDAEGLRGGILHELQSEVAERLLGQAIQIDVPPGAVVYREDASPRVIVVVRGLLRVFMSSPEGRQVTIRYGRSGDVLGLALVLGGPAPVSIQALTGSSVVALRTETLRRLLATDARVSRLCAEEMARQYQGVLEGVAENAFLTVRQRVAIRLLDLAEPRAGRHPVVHLSQQELADAVASVREVVTRTVQQMRRERLIEVGRGEIVIQDPIGLSEVGGISRDDDRRRGPIV